MDISGSCPAGDRGGPAGHCTQYRSAFEAHSPLSQSAWNAIKGVRGHDEGMTRNHLEEVALQLLDQTRADHPDPYRIANARLFAISGLNEVRLLSEVADIYVAIDSIPCLHKTIGEDPLLAVETCGFASPVDDQDVPPSVHPKRRRVRLVVVSNSDGDSGSALEFSDQPGEPITTPSGKGQLADELAEAMRRLELIQSLPLNDHAQREPDDRR